MVRRLIGVYGIGGWCATAGRQTLGDMATIKGSHDKLKQNAVGRKADRSLQVIP